MMANIKVLPRQTALELLWDKVTKLAGLGLPSLWSTGVAAPSLTAELDSNICRPDQGTPAMALQ